MTDFGQRPRQLLKTGQTILYEAGDDGDLEKGLAHAYIPLYTGQHAGTFDITINAKTHALSNNVVQDNSTGLMWWRYVCDGDIGPGNDGKLYWKDDTNSEDIFELVAQANSGSGLGGYVDWRMANRRETENLITVGVINPSIDGTTFPSTPTAYHWTSSTHKADTALAWAVYFGYGNLYYYNKQATTQYCRLVRGGA